MSFRRHFATFICLSVFSQTVIAGTIVIESNTSDWTKSTVRTSGVLTGLDWTSLLTPSTLPDASTFTLAPTTITPGHVSVETSNLGVTPFTLDGGSNTPTGVQFYRSTFDLTGQSVVSADLTLIVDNAAQIFINGQEVGREVTITGNNWTVPYPSFTIENDGSISNVSEFDTTFPFTSWINGTNEIIIAGMNPDNEGNIAGGLGFRMELTTQTVPEPSALAMLLPSLLFGGLLRRGYFRKRRC